MLLIVLAAVTGGSARLGRRRIRSGRAAEAHQRALDTIGRLAARHADDHLLEADGEEPDRAEPPPASRPSVPGRAAGQAHVRLVPAGSDDRPQAAPPRLRSQPRHASDAQTDREGAAPVRVTRPTTPAPPILSVDRPADEPRPPPESEHRAEPIVLIFDDTGPPQLSANGATDTGPTAASARPSPDRQQRRRNHRGRHQRDRWLRLRVDRRSPVVVGAGVVALIGVTLTIGILVGRSGHHPSTPGASVPAGRISHPTTADSARTSTPARSTATVDPSPPAPAPGPAATLVSTTTGFALYRLSPAASVTVTASGRCWIEVRTGSSTGALTFEGILTTGGTYAVTGAAWIRLGDPVAATISVNGSALNPPGFQSGQPYDVQFE